MRSDQYLIGGIEASGIERGHLKGDYRHRGSY
jgi:hypothetical protein